jgi:hypothetical protein
MRRFVGTRTIVDSASIAGRQPDPMAGNDSYSDVSRRGFLRSAGLLGAGAAAGALPATAAVANETAGPRRGLRWLAGDHHVHTQYSLDGLYRVVDQARHANANGLDWLVFTDHGSVAHESTGAERMRRDVLAAREEIADTLIFLGLEWNIPAAEHGTVFVHPGREELAVLREFERQFDGDIRGARLASPENEALAIAGLNFLAGTVAQQRVRDALFLANHPARRGVNTPHEIRGWRDAQPHIAIGFEGAPGHQPSGIAPPYGFGLARGLYYLSPVAGQSFPGYPVESYRTWGGFDWMTATVGGLWDSLLAEGRPWWITASSDAHTAYPDAAVTGPGSDFATNGRLNDPVYGGRINPSTFDFWPGLYSRTHVGATDFSHAAVMAGLRAGRIWVDHGGLISGLDVRLRSAGRWAPLGGTLVAPAGNPVELVVTVDLANGPNWAQFIPQLSRVDVIRGSVTGLGTDPDAFAAPETSVVRSFEVSQSAGSVSFSYDLGRLDRPYYVRLRGTDGNRVAPGYLGAAVDPAGPAMDAVGAADPWTDLWFYSNPIWARPAA